MIRCYYYNIIESCKSNEGNNQIQEMERVAENAKLYRAERKVKKLFEKEQKLKNLTYKITLLDIIEIQKKETLLLKEKATRDEESARRKERYERYTKIGSSEVVLSLLKKMRKSYGYDELIHLDPFDPTIDYYNNDNKL